MRVLSEVLGRGTAWRLLPPSTPEQLAPTPAQLETEEGNSVPTLHPESAQAARLPSLPTDDGAASSHRDEPPSFGMNTLQPPGALPTRLEGAGLSCDLQPDGSLQFVMRDDPRNECAPLPHLWSSHWVGGLGGGCAAACREAFATPSPGWGQNLPTHSPWLPRRYGVPRELGAVLIQGTQLRVIIPRVHADRTVAQFRVQAPAVGVGPLCRAVVVGVGVVVLVLARLRSRPTHAWRRRTGAGGLVVAALLEQHRPQAHDGARSGAPRREQQGQARAHQVPAVAASPWPTAPKHHPRTHRCVCCQSRHEGGRVARLSSCGQPFQSGIHRAALCLSSALRGAHAVRLLPLSTPNAS